MHRPIPILPILHLSWHLKASTESNEWDSYNRSETCNTKQNRFPNYTKKRLREWLTDITSVRGEMKSPFVPFLFFLFSSFWTAVISLHKRNVLQLTQTETNEGLSENSHPTSFSLDGYSHSVHVGWKHPFFFSFSIPFLLSLLGFHIYLRFSFVLYSSNLPSSRNTRRNPPTHTLTHIYGFSSLFL